MTLSLNVLLIKDNGIWSAQCLEHNIAAQGTTTSKATMELARTIVGELVLRSEKGINGLSDVPRAPDMYWKMFGESEQLKTTRQPLFRPDSIAPPAFMIPEFLECRVA